jgi:hypothetical protein
MPGSRRASLPSLFALTVAWVALAAATLAPFAPPWPSLPAATTPAPGRHAAVAELASGLAHAAVFGAGLVWAGVALPLLGLTWLALPRRDRRSFPWLVSALAAGAGLALVRPDSDGALVVVLALPPLVSLEVLRCVLTAVVHRVSAPGGAPVT